MADTLLEIEIDGQNVQAKAGSTVMDVAMQQGVYIPHFCYHKKLSIAANCRMCLVQVEKAPKPMPACATPITPGMKVFTRSEMALTAQKAVMEFLLINHPLDCPVCDQGGECQLQDMSIGFGGDKSRYQEEKRVVHMKDIGPLISMQEMSRCIHCTRCVRFGQEIAGVMELGMAQRNMHSEITTFLGRSVDSELSGNMIDICPVGALTSKPFRYTARSWELQRRRSISPHDAIGANLIIQSKQDKVARVLPEENEQVNECWISDKDRFSYEAINSSERLLTPQIKQNGQWQQVSWQDALDYVAHGIKDIITDHGAETLASLVSPHSTLEEIAMLKNILAQLGANQIDYRLRQSDFSADGQYCGVMWLGVKLSEIRQQDNILAIGANLRKDHPLLAQKIRLAKKTKFAQIHCGSDDPLIETTVELCLAPSQIAASLTQLIIAIANKKGVSTDFVASNSYVADSGTIDALADFLLSSGEHKLILLGNVANHCHQAARVHYLAQELATLTNSKLGFCGEAANSCGANALLPAQDGINVNSICDGNKKAFFMLANEINSDFANPIKLKAALQQAKMVVALSSFDDAASREYADVILPIATFAETAGSFVNCEGRWQSFAGVVAAPGEVKPAWKVLRVIANLLGLKDFTQNNIEDVRSTLLSDILNATPDNQATFINNLSNHINAQVADRPSTNFMVERIGKLAIYRADPLVRRATSLQKTADSKKMQKVQVATNIAERLAISSGNQVKVSQDDYSLQLEAVIDKRLPDNTVVLAADLGLGEIYGEISVERVS